MEVQGIVDGDPVEAALGAAMTGGGLGGVAGAFVAAEFVEEFDNNGLGGFGW